MRGCNSIVLSAMPTTIRHRNINLCGFSLLCRIFSTLDTFLRQVLHCSSGAFLFLFISLLACISFTTLKRREKKNEKNKNNLTTATYTLMPLGFACKFLVYKFYSVGFADMFRVFSRLLLKPMMSTIDPRAVNSNTHIAHNIFLYSFRFPLLANVANASDT